MTPQRPGAAPRAARALAFRAGIVLVALCSLAGCATYASRVAGVREALSEGDLDAAVERAAKSRPPASKVLGLLEQGLVLHYAGRHEDSNRAFEEAEREIEDLYTKSLSREAAALVTSDNLLPWRGEPFEQVFVNYYRALNYLALGERDEALVECRRVSLKLQGFRDAAAAGGGSVDAFPDDAFLQYLTGMIYEAGGETNDAFISYRAALEDYARYEAAYGLRAPPSLAADLLRTAESLGFTDEFDRVRAAHPGIPEGSWRRTPGEGEVVLLHESGFIPHRIEQSLDLPILESDAWEDDREFAPVLAGRAFGHHRGVWTPDGAKIRYWLRIAIPDYARTPARIDRADVEVGGAPAGFAPAVDLGAIALARFDEERPRILVRTIVRALAKYGIHEAVAGDDDDDDDDDRKGTAATPVGGTRERGRRGEKKGDDGGGWRRFLGFLVNAAGAATESADTRSWLVLPERISLARVRVPAGTHAIAWRFLDAGGRRVDAATDSVTVRAGRMTFVTRRTCR